MTTSSTHDADGNPHQLSDGAALPATGLGTYPLAGEDGIRAMVSALEVGYRYLDSAVNYGNEAEVGEALRRSGLPREQVQVATKIPGRFHSERLARTSLEDSARALGVDQIDVALIHWPNPSQDLYPQAWRALVAAQRDGLVRTIGVSNFTQAHLERVIDDTGVVPALNQVELHPRFPQAQMREVHARLGILTQAWSPLGKSTAPFDEPAVVAPATTYGVTPAQVVLRWHRHLGTMPVPKSASTERQRANLHLPDFTLTDKEMAAISALARDDGRRFGGDPDTHEEM